ncbi:FG-GAP-like repeat-containing protein [Micavibrio aeruginosavorus]|uniref:FG-GAP-like repeat-containing protein n=1 Tax=Micavibrio aeruginosavorus TaxID=349221 RepID=UPI003F4ADF07
MARNVDGSVEGVSSSDQGPVKTIDANGQTKIDLPDSSFITDATMIRDGQDLVLHNDNGQTITIENYFIADTAPVLSSPNGAILSPAMVQSFVHSENAGQYAQMGSVDDVSPVGEITELNGGATVTRADGTTETITLGTKVFQGDVIETQGNGAVNITFVDETSFAVSENAKLAIDEYVFDPASGSGKTDFSVLKGVFVFTSGLIGREDPDDVTIDTPVGSIGIRGTTIMGDIDPSGQSQITVVEGAIVVRTEAGERTLAEQFETVTLTGQDSEPTYQGTLDASRVTDDYGSVKSVSGTLFSAFGADDAPAADSATDEAAPDASETTVPEGEESGAAQESAPAETAPTTDPATQQDGALDLAPTTDMALVGDDTMTGGLDSGFDRAAETGTTLSNVVGSTTNTASSTLSTDGSTLGSTTGNTAPAPITTRPTDTNTPTDPSVLPSTGTDTSTGSGGGTVTPPTPPVLDLNVNLLSNLSDVSLSGLVVGTVSTTVAYTETLSFVLTSPMSGGNPLFQLVSTGPDSANIVLTPAGALAVLANQSLSLSVTVTEPSTGRTATSGNNATVLDAADISLNDIHDASTADGRFIPSIATGSHHANAVAAVGDTDGNGTANYIFASDNTLFLDDNSGNIAQYSLATLGFDNTEGLSINGVGDVDGDGKMDFVVGGRNTASGEGRAVLIGGDGTISGIDGSSGVSHFGHEAIGLGDINGDGFADVMITSPSSSVYGKAGIYLGGSDFSNILTATPDYVINGPSTNSNLGREAASLGDLNQDGFDDFAITVPKTAGAVNGEVWIYNGGNTVNTASPFKITGLQTGADGGLGLLNLGDMNGGYKNDFAIYESGTDTIHVVFGEAHSFAPGGTATISAVSDLRITASDANSKIESGGSVGDYNGDGREDMAVAVRTDSTMDIYVIYGQSGIAGSIDLDNLTLEKHKYEQIRIDLTDPDLGLANPNTDPFEVEISALGDLNGDGYDDFAIGTPNGDGGDGGLYLMYGQSDGGLTSSGQTLVTGTSASATAAGQAVKPLLGHTPPIRCPMAVPSRTYPSMAVRGMM